MAECKVNQTIKVVLYLSEEEASFLKSLCQNSLEDIVRIKLAEGTVSNEELSRTKSLRESIFYALNKAGVK